MISPEKNVRRRRLKILAGAAALILLILIFATGYIYIMNNHFGSCGGRSPAKSPHITVRNSEIIINLKDGTGSITMKIVNDDSDCFVQIFTIKIAAELGNYTVTFIPTLPKPAEAASRLGSDAIAGKVNDSLSAPGVDRASDSEITAYEGSLNAGIIQLKYGGGWVKVVCTFDGTAGHDLRRNFPVRGSYRGAVYLWPYFQPVFFDAFVIVV